MGSTLFCFARRFDTTIAPTNHPKEGSGSKGPFAAHRPNSTGFVMSQERENDAISERVKCDLFINGHMGSGRRQDTDKNWHVYVIC